ncbi:mannitol dehydrogenase family protein [Cellulosimicrobium cellulans]|uniref:mannitol dehydrogenase family protein n=1 Tax=Cellulosimicrobium cellulans TaxID=1710 RepID=UPI0020976F49|nr:mannitol dehydrogenase family protein [Cellulosimicrobium cellulans]MCO7275107.1 mannitol dehydrogenase family protein [Cellulosimicrobium cellulans]
MTAPTDVPSRPGPTSSAATPADAARSARPRLRRAARPAFPPAPVLPTQVGIVHLGIGAFHRAHQAVVTEDAVRATGETCWGILGVTQRSASVRDQLRPQDGVYTVLTVGPDGASPRVVGSVTDVAWPAEETPRVLAALAAPTTHVVTLTVTEKGYARRADGHLDVDAVAGDLEVLRREEAATSSPGGGAPGAGVPGDAAGEDAHGVAAASAVGLLVRGLAARRRAGGAPLTVLSCDNLADNGHVLARLVGEAVDAALPGAEGDALRAWLAASVTFPCSMVDRIVPATTPAQRDEVETLLGARDEGLVVAEQFLQWVIEDRFAGPRPAWERGGATLTRDVAPYERAKLRLLNGAHSYLAYAGSLAGHTTIAEAVADPALAAGARALQADALATLDAPDGVDLAAYAQTLLDRFANPATGHTTRQVAADGTQKIPFRWGATLADLLAARPDAPVPQGVVAALAAWAGYVVAEVRAGRTVDDPRGDELGAVVAGAPDDAAAVRALVRLPGLLPAVPDARLDEIADGAVAAAVGASTTGTTGTTNEEAAP